MFRLSFGLLTIEGAFDRREAKTHEAIPSHRLVVSVACSAVE